VPLFSSAFTMLRFPSNCAKLQPETFKAFQAFPPNATENRKRLTFSSSSSSLCVCVCVCFFFLFLFRYYLDRTAALSNSLHSAFPASCLVTIIANLPLPRLDFIERNLRWKRARARMRARGNDHRIDLAFSARTRQARIARSDPSI